MNEELQKQIAAILKQALEAAQHGGQWLIGQIPDVLRELLAWTVAMGGLSALVILVLAAIDVVIWRKAHALESNAASYDRGDAYFAAACATAVLVLPSAFLFCNVLAGLKALIAPKLFLLEYAAHLVK